MLQIIRSTILSVALVDCQFINTSIRQTPTLAKENSGGLMIRQNQAGA
jgi:hypothetical protein